MVGRVAVGAELARADRREVARVEGEDHPAAAQVREPVGPPSGSRELELGRAVADLDLRHRRPSVPAASSARIDRDGVDGHDLGRLFLRVAELADRVDNVHALGDLAEHRVVGRQAGVGGAVTTKNWLPEAPGGSTAVFAIATRPGLVRGVLGGAARSPCTRDRRYRSPSGRRPGSRTPGRSGERPCRRRSPARPGRRTSSPSSATRSVSRSMVNSPQLVSTVAVAGSPCSSTCSGLRNLSFFGAGASTWAQSPDAAVCSASSPSSPSRVATKTPTPAATRSTTMNRQAASALARHRAAGCEDDRSWRR